MSGHFGFSVRQSNLRDRILIPKYYDPDVDEYVSSLADDYDLPRLADLLLPGERGSRLGDWVRRGEYGGGNIPFVRTSDISNWRIRADYKKGVSDSVYGRLAKRQDVAPGDLLMVAHGTYLVGNVGIITAEDGPIVLQDHVFRLRANPSAGFEPELLLAALSSFPVRRQVRARQFSADIIDKIGNRHLELRIPIPKSSQRRSDITEQVRSILESQSRMRKAIQAAAQSDLRMTRERARAHFGFSVHRSALHSRIVIPKYYDPAIEADIATAERMDGSRWAPLRQLVDSGALEVSGGVEVGKMAYGTGRIPFIRTTDLGDWELKRDFRHGVSDTIYDKYKAKGALKATDVVVVRDGTYLVGASALVHEDDLPALHCGGLLRLRVLDSELSPYALLAALNLPLVRRQMRARQFTRDVIDTMGSRLLEVRVPPLSGSAATDLSVQVSSIMAEKARTKAAISAVIDRFGREPQKSGARPGSSMR